MGETLKTHESDLILQTSRTYPLKDVVLNGFKITQYFNGARPAKFECLKMENVLAQRLLETYLRDIHKSSKVTKNPITPPPKKNMWSNGKRQASRQSIQAITTLK